MCDCNKQVNERLAQHGGQLAMALGIVSGGNMIGRLLIQTVKTDKAKRKPVPRVTARYCPFCGERVVDA